MLMWYEAGQLQVISLGSRPLCKSMHEWDSILLLPTCMSLHFPLSPTHTASPQFDPIGTTALHGYICPQEESRDKKPPSLLVCCTSPVPYLPLSQYEHERLQDTNEHAGRPRRRFRRWFCRWFHRCCCISSNWLAEPFSLIISGVYPLTFVGS